LTAFSVPNLSTILAAPRDYQSSTCGTFHYFQRHAARRVHKYYDEYSITPTHGSGTLGFSGYSEGINDDVLKSVWSGMAWGLDSGGSTTRSAKDAAQLVNQIIDEYANYHGGAVLADTASSLIFALEQSWNGSLTGNAAAISLTVNLTQQLEAAMQERRPLGFNDIYCVYRL
jgi:hypothetical protein